MCLLFSSSLASLKACRKCSTRSKEAWRKKTSYLLGNQCQRDGSCSNFQQINTNTVFLRGLFKQSFNPKYVKEVMNFWHQPGTAWYGFPKSTGWKIDCHGRWALGGTFHGQVPPSPLCHKRLPSPCKELWPHGSHALNQAVLSTQLTPKKGNMFLFVLV